MGAWIETRPFVQTILVALSHPVWVRGLKLNLGPNIEGGVESHPVWVRGLKLSLASVM